jgi:hypothetical protein
MSTASDARQFPRAVVVHVEAVAGRVERGLQRAKARLIDGERR